MWLCDFYGNDGTGRSGDSLDTSESPPGRRFTCDSVSPGRPPTQRLAGKCGNEKLSHLSSSSWLIKSLTGKAEQRRHMPSCALGMAGIEPTPSNSFGMRLDPAFALTTFKLKYRNCGASNLNAACHDGPAPGSDRGGHGAAAADSDECCSGTVTATRCCFFDTGFVRARGNTRGPLSRAGPGHPSHGGTIVMT